MCPLGRAAQMRNLSFDFSLISILSLSSRLAPRHSGRMHIALGQPWTWHLCRAPSRTWSCSATLALDMVVITTAWRLMSVWTSQQVPLRHVATGARRTGRPTSTQFHSSG
ncbi:hypothetical protein BD413DRAFT_702151 [Trametes elegans]|nr:hypothetical protein BD413DRAFT_702151 [Trametes elegans]